MKKILKLVVLLVVLTFCFTSSVRAASNPYGKYQSLYGVTTVRCTWYAWQQAYEHTGVALPSWGNAQTWYNSAINDGYKVGSEAKPNSIAVWSSSDGYGHVGFVVSVEGNIMTVNEAGIVTEENEGIVNGAQKYTTAGNLIGFIYLEEARTNNTTSPNNTNESNVNNNTTNEEKSNNNKLATLNIDDVELNFDAEITEYQVEVDYNTPIIKISATAEEDTATIFGTGEKALKVGENNYTITVIAEDGSQKEYNIIIIRLMPQTLEYTEVKEEKKSNINVFLLGTILLLICLIVGGIILMKRKKKNKKGSVRNEKK